MMDILTIRLPTYQITCTEALRYKEKELFRRKKIADRIKQPKMAFYITFVEYDPQKSLKKKLSKLEKWYEQAVMKKPLLANRILRSAMSVARRLDA